jgi:hypothetical protein
VFVLVNALIAGAQALLELPIILQPPEGRLGEDQVLAALGPHRLQEGDGLFPLGIVAQVAAIRLRRKVPAYMAAWKYPSRPYVKIQSLPAWKWFFKKYPYD